jgi:capsular exopolysaccharide synthesis family protein
MANSTPKVNDQYKIFTLESPESLVAESFRMLQVNVSFSGIDEKMQVIQISSALPGEAKTTVAINLAAAYAEKGRKVLLFDLDLRKPKVHRAFNLRNVGFGLTSYIAGECEVTDIIKKTETGIDVILRGAKSPFPNVILESKKLKDLIEDLRDIYDLIIIDTPPVLLVTDAVLVSRIVDGTIFIVAYNQTKKDSAKEALNVLIKNKANVIGTVLTKVDAKHAKSYFGYGAKYKYYQDDKDTK